MLRSWDTRQSSPAHKTTAHSSEANCVDFNPFQEFLLATGGGDKVHCSLAARHDNSADR